MWMKEKKNTRSRSHAVPCIVGRCSVNEKEGKYEKHTNTRTETNVLCVPTWRTGAHWVFLLYTSLGSRINSYTRSCKMKCPAYSRTYSVLPTYLHVCDRMSFCTVFLVFLYIFTLFFFSCFGFALACIFHHFENTTHIHSYYF